MDYKSKEKAVVGSKSQMENDIFWCHFYVTTINFLAFVFDVANAFAILPTRRKTHEKMLSQSLTRYMSI